MIGVEMAHDDGTELPPERAGEARGAGEPVLDLEVVDPGGRRHARSREPKDLPLALEVAEAWRVCGRSLDRAALRLEITKAQAGRLLKLAQRYWQRQAGLSYGEAVAQELELLDYVERTAKEDHYEWVARGRPDREDAYRYLEVLVKVGARRAALMGLDAPKRVDVDLRLPPVGDPEAEARKEGIVVPPSLEEVQGRLQRLLSGTG